MTSGKRIDDEAESEQKGVPAPLEVGNRDLDELLEFYDAYDLLPYANHIIWLASVKEVLGYIPFHLDYSAIRCLVILKEEESKKTMMDSQKMQQEAQSAQRGTGGTPVGLNKALIKR